jgi:hypothetical protein
MPLTIEVRLCFALRLYETVAKYIIDVFVPGRCGTVRSGHSSNGDKNGNSDNDSCSNKNDGSNKDNGIVDGDSNSKSWLLSSMLDQRSKRLTTNPNPDKERLGSFREQSPGHSQGKYLLHIIVLVYRF